MGCDEPEAMAAALRRVALERDRYKWSVENLRGQCKSLRQQLRRERAEHLATHKRLEALRGELFGSNTP